jgi:hypothetical protein
MLRGVVLVTGSGSVLLSTKIPVTCEQCIVHGTDSKERVTNKREDFVLQEKEGERS